IQSRLQLDGLLELNPPPSPRSDHSAMQLPDLQIVSNAGRIGGISDALADQPNTPAFLMLGRSSNIWLKLGQREPD
ncbi:MAG: hypothetical protein J4N81_14410, partial [Chloroflexi bacterium]|nr:hypothetical protein [Chloroflexota bacterium]